MGGTNEIIPKKLLMNREKLSPHNLAEHIKDTFNRWEELKLKYKDIYKEDKKKFSWEENIKKYLDS